ncbi:MAG: DegQ family serine endoprotease [Thermodesulfovibrionales bacterium]|nr:DegQ family serine endoprotease [Thermodesulfovibrionales bacterium]
MRRKSLIAVAGLFLIAGLIMGLLISSNLDMQTEGITAHDEPSTESINILSSFSNAMVDVVSAVRPTVVNISTTRVVTTRGGGSAFNDPFFRKFFGDQFRQDNAPREEERSSLGSGVIVSVEGYILTNNHVIKDADTITVTLADKREFEGKLVGTDPKTDIAVIKIDAKDLHAIDWGNSDDLRVGEFVIAVGSPYGLDQTVTSGIVSAKGRANVRIADYEDFIQTDAAINPGNSGGPLINIRGELVGINTAIFSTSGGYQGIGFSIPSNMVQVVMDSLIKHGKVVRGWLGVTIQPVTSELAEQFKLKEARGAIVSDVTEDSPADKGGLRRGDVIIEFEGKKVTDSTGLRNMVAATAPNTKVSFRVSRNGKLITVKVTIGELSPEKLASTGDYNNVLRNVQIQELTPEIKQSLGISPRVSGVVVTDAPEDTGLQRADVILEINRHSVENVEAYNKVVARVPEDSDVLLLVFRKGGAFYLTISP